MVINVAILDGLRQAFIPKPKRDGFERYVIKEIMTDVGRDILKVYVNTTDGLDIIKLAHSLDIDKAGAMEVYTRLFDVDECCFSRIIEKVAVLGEVKSFMPILYTLHALYTNYASSPSMTKEIERKFLIQDFPTDRLPLQEEATIWQGYLSVNPEIRIRKRINTATGKQDYKLAMKSKGNNSRMEVQFNISEALFNALRSYIGSYPLIEKDFKTYSLDGYKLECGKVDNGQLMYAEVEFESEEDANNFDLTQIPLLLKEVTDDSKFKMASYWQNTRLKF